MELNQQVLLVDENGETKEGRIAKVVSPTGARIVVPGENRFHVARLDPSGEPGTFTLLTD